jgi:glycosyltransferase involved in cell wall biosynthesis
VVICNGGRGALATVIAARRLGLPVVCIVQLIYSGSERHLLRWCYGRGVVKHVTFCSTMAAAPFQSLGAKAVVVANWVSPPFLDTPPPGATHEARTRVGVLGRISPTKGQRLFLEALLPLLEERPSLDLVLGGANDFESGDERTRLEALTAASGLADRVRFAGSVDALAFLDTLDVLVVPSLWEEPFGLVAVEGMARGLPVVATRSGALPEIIADGVTGTIVEKDPTALRDAVRHLIDDRPDAERLGAAGRRRVEEHFHPARQLQIVYRLVAAAISGPN